MDTFSVCSTDRKQAADIFEWFGDVVLEELAARCLIHPEIISKLNARDVVVLRRTLVTNERLSSVFLALKCQHRFPTHETEKAQADAIEAIIGEMYIRLQDKAYQSQCIAYKKVTDVILAQSFLVERQHWTESVQDIVNASINLFQVLDSEEEDYADQVTHLLSKPRRPLHTPTPLLELLQAAPKIVHSQLLLKALEECDITTTATPNEIQMYAMYGSSVMKKRISYGLCQLYQHDRDFSAGMLTIYIQSITSKDNLAISGHLLGICPNDALSAARTLRARLGYLVQFTKYDALVDLACAFITHYGLALKSEFSTFFKTEWPVHLTDITMDELPETTRQIQKLVSDRTTNISKTARKRMADMVEDYDDLDDFSVERPTCPMIGKQYQILTTSYEETPYVQLLEKLVIAFAENDMDKQQKICMDESLSGFFCQDIVCTESMLGLPMDNSYHRLVIHQLCRYHRLQSESKGTAVRTVCIKRPRRYKWHGYLFSGAAAGANTVNPGKRRKKRRKSGISTDNKSLAVTEDTRSRCT